MNPRYRYIVAATCLLICSSSQAGTQFLDDFSGPNLNPNWQASLSTMNVATPGAGSTQSTTYLGAPNYSFQSFGTDAVLRASSMLNVHQRRGWSTVSVYNAPDFRYEIRFNTLNQSGSTSIDAFVEIGIIDAANPSRYEITSLYGGFFSNFRQFAAGSSVDNAYSVTDVGYQNNTWYRLVLEAAPGQHIRASILSDAGVELSGFTLDHGVEAYPSGFKLFLSQAMGEPDPAGTYPVDVAIDFARLTTTVPELAIRVSDVELCWQSQSNQLWQVQYRTNATGTWTNLGPPVQSTNSTTCIKDEIARGSQHRFYQVLRVQ